MSLQNPGENLPREREVTADILSPALRSISASEMMRRRPGTQESGAGAGPCSRPDTKRLEPFCPSLARSLSFGCRAALLFR